MFLAKQPKAWEGSTDEERHDHIEELFEYFVDYLSYWIEAGYIAGDCVVDYAIFKDVVRNYYGDLHRLSVNMKDGDDSIIPNEYKQHALFSFWIRKLKPIINGGMIVDIKEDLNCLTNELIALQIALAELDVTFTLDVTHNMPVELYRDFLVFFRYKSVSPHALYLVFASMYSVNPLKRDHM